MSRRATKKSRNGCTTCKIRRVKCDELHPSCYRCTSTGRKCDGYDTALIVQYEQPQSVPKGKLFINKTPSQIQAYEFFVTRLIPGMSRIVKGDFWDRHLLQAAHSEQAVWLAINSLSELIRQVGNDSRPSKQSSHAALQWYGQSMQVLQGSIRRRPGWSNTCSITSILYMCIECVLNNLGGAFRFYTQAMQALMSSPKNDKDSIHSSVMALFCHITAAHGLPLPVTRQSLSLPFTFQSLYDARQLLEELVGPAQKVVLSVEADRKKQSRDWQPSEKTLLERDRILDLLVQWDEALKVSRLGSTFEGTDDALNWSSMYLGQITYIIWLSSVPEPEKEMAFDNHHAKFEEMLRHAEIVVETCGGRQTLFSFETRVLSMLTFVATRCRHPVLRRRAVNLTHCGPRIESSRKAADAVKMCQRIVAFEESGSIDAEYHELPKSLELPPDENRIAWASSEHVVNDDGLVSMYVRFGKWQLGENGTSHLTAEVIEI